MDYDSYNDSNTCTVRYWSEQFADEHSSAQTAGIEEHDDVDKISRLLRESADTNLL